MKITFGLTLLIFFSVSDHISMAQDASNARSRVVLTDRAREIHASGFLFDGHNDLPWQMRKIGKSSFDFLDIRQHQPELHTDIDRLKKGGVKAQFWSVYVPATTQDTGDALLQTLQQVELVHNMVKRYPDVFALAATAAELREISNDGRIGGMLGVEGGYSIENSLGNIQRLYDLGCRYMTLTHSRSLEWADSATDEPRCGGLSEFGVEVIHEMNRVGMLVDLSHVSADCMRKSLAVTRAPVIFSHSSAQALNSHPRNVPDEVLKMMPQNGGVAMVNFFSKFVIPTSLLETNDKALGSIHDVVDHIEHIIEVAGIDHVGIGSDFDGVPRLPEQLEDVSTYPLITQELLNRGHSPEEIHKLLGDNVMRVLCKAEDVAREMQRDTTTLPTAEPATVGMASKRLDVIDDVVAEGLGRGRMPGCVVMVGRSGKIVYHKAFGLRQTGEASVAMTKDTVFDLASLTKPIATATSVMLLAEDGQLSVDDNVVKHIPEFAANGKDVITIRQLLTHTGGLIPDNSLKDYADGAETAIAKICELKLYAEPGERFIYSDVGFMVLAEIVKRISGESIAEFSKRRVFEPLGMSETMYVPRADLRKRSAPTEKRDGDWMRGQVHDPRAWAMGGVAGHAGLFSTASDLAVYCDMLIRQGVGQNDQRIMKSETVALMTAPQKVSSGLRTLGWDMRSPYSSNRGDFFSAAAFGHGGFTGTAMWIDPEQELFVIFLSNRVHPDGKGSVNSLAGRIATIAGAAICEETASSR